VILTVQLPFALWPLIRFTSDRGLMGVFANGLLTKAVAWLIFVVIAVANAWLISGILTE